MSFETDNRDLAMSGQTKTSLRGRLPEVYGRRAEHVCVISKKSLLPPLLIMFHDMDVTVADDGES